MEFSMRKLIGSICLCGLLAACFPKSEQGRDSMEGVHPDAALLRAERKKAAPTVRKKSADTLAEDTVDHFHLSMKMYTSSYDGSGTDTIYHYPTGEKICMGKHFGRNLYLELGEFYDDLTYDGAKLYWGDSLIYSTGLEVANDWRTCSVQHVDSTDMTYVLLLIDDRPNPSFWHIVCMDGMNIRLADYVLAGNDYREGGRYFHDNMIFEDLDSDGLIEVGGKYWTEYWADSMTYQPCHIYKLGRKLTFDEASSESETRKAYKGLFLGLERGQAIYNPNTEQHEKHMEEEESGR